MPNRGGFSWKRAVGISAAKSRISRKAGVPLTKSGRQRKVGRMMTGGGCVVPALALVLAATAAALAACDSAASSPEPAPSGIGLASPRFPGYLRVFVTVDNHLLVEQRPMTVPEFSALLYSESASPPIILYGRENPYGDPPPIAKDVLDAVIAHRLVVGLVEGDFTAPEYTPPPRPSGR